MSIPILIRLWRTGGAILNQVSDCLAISTTIWSNMTLLRAIIAFNHGTIRKRMSKLTATTTISLHHSTTNIDNAKVTQWELN
jgi:hypothetical protein